jgi:hypothetical protein
VTDTLTAERLKGLERLANEVVQFSGSGLGYSYSLALEAFEGAADPETVLALLAERGALLARIRELEGELREAERALEAVR